MAELFANSGDPDQTPRSATSDLSLHCLSINLFRISRLQLVKNCWMSDSTPCSATSDESLHCLPFYHNILARLQSPMTKYFFLINLFDIPLI